MLRGGIPVLTISCVQRSAAGRSVAAEGGVSQGQNLVSCGYVAPEWN
jgi:hypothetical protein